MEIRTVEQYQQAKSEAAQAKRGGESGLGQDDFLRLMMEQMKAQDPFNPMDNTEFISQMAQLTSVSSISEMNNNFASYLGSLNQTQFVNASNLVGREVMSQANFGVLSGSNGISGQVQLPNSTNALDVEILAPSGEVLGRVSMGPQSAGPVSFKWDGTGLDGEQLPAGKYYLRANYLNGGSVEQLSTQINFEVKSVTLPSAGGGVQLQLEGGGSVKLSDLVSVS